ncbi:MFS transporter [Maricaulaceae bacterium NA33B04]|nr:MFS transporter [Maricaulaceae bacterium NA33B04]
MIARLLIHETHARTRSLSAAILAAALSGCGFGLLMPLIALNLEAMTGSGVVVGTNGAAAALSTIIATPFIPALLARFAPRVLMVVCALMTGAGILAFPFFPDVTVWWLLRFAVGLTVTVVFVGSETWINQLARPEGRATLLAVYAATLSGGFGSGALILWLVGSEGYAPWIVGGLIYVIGAMPLIFLRGPDLTSPEQGETGLKAMGAMAKLAPAAILAGLIFGALETSIFTLVPVYASRLAFEDGTIGILMAIGALGGIALQVPLGRLADRTGHLRTLRLIAGCALILPLLMALSGANLIGLVPLIFLFAGISSAFYTVGLALVGERVKAGAMAAANSAFIFAYGVGSLFGPPVAGAAMDGFDPWGLMIAFSGLALLYLLGSWAEKGMTKD